MDKTGICRGISIHGYLEEFSEELSEFPLMDGNAHSATSKFHVPSV